tara:strand:+ start:2738 stop:3229 length:492 start_codon:yes stop_codon:yes gene_type:complete
MADTKYKEEYAEQARKLCLLGATDKDLADFFEVCEKTVNNWKKDFPDFLQSIKRGKTFADANVAESLYNRACGYTHQEEKVFVSEGSIISHEVTKHYPPETAAVIFWLKNRDPQKWRDKQEVDLNADLSKSLADRLSRACERVEGTDDDTDTGAGTADNTEGC